MTCWGYGGLFSGSPPFLQRSWNGTIILHIMKQPHGQFTHSEKRFCACPLNVLHYGGGKRLGTLLGGGTEKRPPCPHIESIYEYTINDTGD